MATVRLESFPFDSKFDGYDEEGYPVYDRAVGAGTLRAAFRQFFADGVFGTPADAWKITKGDGLSVKVAPGTAVIRGGVASAADEVTLKLSDAAPQGRMTYSILLRLDDNVEYRSIYLVASEGEAGADAAPKVPQDDAGAKELRLGYVVVPSGATDLSGAEIVSEKGSSVCPYAAPFEDIDMSEFFENLKSKGDEAFSSFVSFLESNREFIESALDGTTAGALQVEIEKLKGTLANDAFWEYANRAAPSDDGGKHATVENIRYFRLKTATETLDNAAFFIDVFSPNPAKPDAHVTVSNINAYANESVSLDSLSWSQLAAVSKNLTAENKDRYYAKFRHFLGQTKSVAIAGFGTFEFEVIGVCQDVDENGKPLLLSLLPKRDAIAKRAMNSTDGAHTEWSGCDLRSWLSETVLPALPSDLQAAISPASKKSDKAYGSYETTSDKLWLLARDDVRSSSSTSTVYERFASAPRSDFIRYIGAEAIDWWLRDANRNNDTRFTFYYIESTGLGSTLYTKGQTEQYGVVPGFCI